MAKTTEQEHFLKCNMHSIAYSIKMLFLVESKSLTYFGCNDFDKFSAERFVLHNQRFFLKGFIKVLQAERLPINNTTLTNFSNYMRPSG